MKHLVFIALCLFTTAGFSQSIDGSFKVLTASGTNTYTVSEAFPAAYSNKERFLIRFTNANSGAATLNRNGLGAKSIKKADGSDLSTGDILAGEVKLLVYTGIHYQIIGGVGGGGLSGSGTSNELAYFTGPGALSSLSTSTYPNLTETSYLKGVASAIQTQLNSRVDLTTGQTIGGKKVFTPTSTLAGLNVGSVTGFPSSASNGDISYASTPNEFVFGINGIQAYAVHIASASTTSAAGRIPTLLSSDRSRLATTAGFDFTSNVLNVPGQMYGTLTDAGTNTMPYGLRLRHTSTNAMANNFGLSVEFVNRDTDAVDNLVGRVGVGRDGADNSGKMVLNTVAAGVETTQLNIASTGNVGIGMGNTSSSDRLQIWGSGTGTNLAISVRNSGGTNRFSVQDNGGINHAVSGSGVGITSGANFLNFTAANSVTAGSNFALFSTAGSFNIANQAFVRIQPNLSHAGANGGAGFAVGDQTYGTAIAGSNTVYGGQFYMGNTSAASFTSNAVVLNVGTKYMNGTTSFNPNAGAATWRGIEINPIFNTTGTYGGNVYGIDYNPTLTSLTGAIHYAFRATSGKFLIGDLAGGGNRIVTVNNNGDVGAVSLASSGNKAIYATSSGDLTLDGGSPILTANETVSGATLRGVGTSPRTLIPAPGAGLYINVISVTFTYDYSTTAYDFGSDLQIKNPTSGNAAAVITPTIINGTLDLIRVQASTYGPTANEALVLTEQSGSNATQGVGSLKIVVRYTIESFN